MTKHTLISFVKSGNRLVAAGLLMFCTGNSTLFLVGLALAGAEVLGIIEELPGMYKGTDTGSNEVACPICASMDQVSCSFCGGAKKVPRPDGYTDPS